MTPPPSRDQLVELLLEPAFYPHPVEQIQLFSTHISDVFLTGHYAYKLKRPVDFGFLDFTSLAARHHFCLEEVRLNRRLAPQIYLAVLPITQEADGRLVLDGAGRPVDWLVKMTQFPTSGLLTEVLARGELSGALMERVGSQVADFHRQAEIPAEADQYGSITAIRAPVEQNFAQTEGLQQQGVIDHALWKHLRHWAATVLQSHQRLFAERLTRQRIRAYHGDLHLRNICLVDGEPLIFDCIEFNDHFRHGDTVADWGFLVMDLDYRGRADLANRFLNRYLLESDDFHGLPLAAFYQSYRAIVRAKVAGFQLDGTTGAAREALLAEVRGYFDLANRYTQLRPHGLVIMCGLSGSGKSQAASQLAEQVGAVVIRSDAVRKHLAGLSPAQRTESGLKGGVYSPDMSARTYAGLLERAESVRQAGLWAVLDATFLHPDHRAAAVAWARRNHLPVHIVHTHCSDERLAHYLAQRAQQGTDISEANAVVVAAQRREYQPPQTHEADGVHHLDTSGPPDLEPIRRALQAV